jgi:hypothetical protein
MPAPRSKLSAIIAGSLAGLLAVVILLMVPILGVRKEFNLVVLNWQELVFYCACLLVGTVSGARLGYRESKSAGVFSEAASPFVLNAVSEPDETVVELHADSLNVADNAGSSSISVGSNTAAGHSADSSRTIDDSGAVSRIPQIEESLAGGPKKRPHRFWTEASKVRTRVLLIFLYLLLFVMCAVLCQKINLGNIVTDALTAEIIRNVGLGFSILGLYLMVRGMFVTTAPFKLKLKKEEQITVSGWTASTSHHVPPTRLEFLLSHPVCTGWLGLLTGLPLIFLAWFPLIAIPGLFVAMNWLFVERNTDLALSD